MLRSSVLARLANQTKSCANFLTYTSVMCRISLLLFSRSENFSGFLGLTLKLLPTKFWKNTLVILSRFRFFSLLTCLYTIWYFIQFSRYMLPFRVWWRIRGSNPWPPACKAGALPAELIPHMLVFLRTYCVTARFLRYSHTSVCSVPRNSRALYLRKNPAHFVCSPLHKASIFAHFCFFKTVIVQKLMSP